ncbi:Ras family guanine nucleotide exchange factor [Maudiozyma humilis]|uniref:Ras family guanine nucleotide exchange factor n=1 Tax=Maudiozyma humilis TaxID=51915 RepID=A0AAV5S1A1_MAUHU|nr:Ras family guanine nucleotide exchange factor [Kazachstania humilis]
MNISNPTTPLFKYDKKPEHADDKRFTTTVSPTKPLEFTHRIDEEDIAPSFPRDNATSTTLTTVADSFETALSHRTDVFQSQTSIAESRIPERQHAFNDLVRPIGTQSSETPKLSQGDYALTPENYNEDMTPKVNNQILDTIKQSTFGNDSNENLGLGIITQKTVSTVSSSARSSEIIQSIRASIVPRETKPIRSQVASTVSTGSTHSPVANTVSSKDTYHNQQQDGSPTYDDTVNTFDNGEGSSESDASVHSAENKTHLDEISNYTYLFIRSIHSFDVRDLENQEDVDICLSFDKDEVAFVHNVDESGWGEITLISNQARGWVPFNYFTDIIDPTKVQLENIPAKDRDIEYWRELIDSKLPLQKLLYSSAKFLINPKSEKTSKGGMSFNIEDVNAIRDGVKGLLEMTGAVSRSDDIVKKSEPVKRARKKLLADWYNLMIKADYYKHTTSDKNISNLIKLVYEVLRKAFTFYNAWSRDKVQVEKEIIENISKPASQEKEPQSYDIRYLPEPPYAIQRLNEINDILFSYASLILGRLDLIEHNPIGCETLELMVHQIIILLRELLYISKSCSQNMRQKYNNSYENIIDKHLDPLLALVSELVSCIKNLVTQTLQDELQRNVSASPKKYDQLTIKDGIYHYSTEGKRLIKIISSMTSLISNTWGGCNNYLRVIGNFRLSSERQYPDFTQIMITPEEFVKRCSEGLAKTLDKAKITDKSTEDVKKTRGKYRSVVRFSSIRVGINEDENGNTSHISITPQGSQFLNELMHNEDKAFSRDSTFDKFKLDDTEYSTKMNDINNSEVIEKEILFDSNNNLIGASFRALIYKLTDELDKPENNLIVTVLLNYRRFSKPIDLVNELINRFDVDDKSSQFEYDTKNGNYSSRASRLKNRRRLVCKLISTWMENYWDFYNDYLVLPTLINFFNEAVVNYLPIESKKLILSASKLFSELQFSPVTGKSTSSQIETNEIYNDHWNSDELSASMKQLMPRSTSRSKTSSIISDSSSLSNTSSSFSLDERLIEEYGLTNVQNAENNLLALPLPVLNLGTATLLTGENKYTIQSLLSKYNAVRSAMTTINGSIPQRNGSSGHPIARLLSNWDHLNDTIGNLPSNIASDLNGIRFSLTDLNPLEIAKQITLLESYMFNHVEQFELVNHRKLNICPNVVHIMNFTNQLSNYVIESVLDTSISLAMRVQRLNCWLRVALSSLYFRNFNSLASIMTSLQSPSISRIKQIWASLDNKDRKLYEYLARIVYPSHNYKVYRGKLSKILGDTQSLKTANPTVPFFNIYLQDLTFIEDGNPDYRNPDSFRPNKLVNIDKYLRITQIITSMETLQTEYDEDSDDSDTYDDGSAAANAHDSFFQLTDQLNIETNFITPMTDLQELIMCEFWRVNRLYKADSERGYALSLKLIPRT